MGTSTYDILTFVMIVVPVIGLIVYAIFWLRNAMNPVQPTPDATPVISPATEAIVQAIVQRATTEIQRVADEAVTRVQIEVDALDQLMTSLSAHPQALASPEPPALPAANLVVEEVEKVEEVKEVLPVAPVTPVVQEIPSPSGNHREAVTRLADQGVSAPAIAQQLGISRGEVELLLVLRRQLAPAASHPAKTQDEALPTLPAPEIEATLQQYFSDDPMLSTPLAVSAHREALTHAETAEA